MSTYMAKKSEVERKWYVIDAAGKPLGKAFSCQAPASLATACSLTSAAVSGHPPT